MSELKPVPMSVKSPMDTTYQITLAVGDAQVEIPDRKANSYWIVVIDRTTLKPVYNQVHTNPDTAPDIGPYDADNYMLVVCSVALGTGYVPQGAFYDFLYGAGAGTQLDRIVQVNQQIGCGEVGKMSYILVGLLGPGRPNTPGIELAQTEYYASGPILTIQLIPADISGTVVYTPSRMGN
jgi:hypothetical protein